MKMIATIMDSRYSGIATHLSGPAVSPTRCRYKWAFWKKPIIRWAVVQPKNEFIGRNYELVWRHVAIFTEKQDAVDFCNDMLSGYMGDSE